MNQHDLRSEIDELFTGHLIKDLVTRCQESLEEMRPLPVRFENKYELMHHLMDVHSTVLFPGKRLKSQRKAQELRDYYHAENAQQIAETRLPLLGAQRAYNLMAGISERADHDLLQQRAEQMTPVDHVIAQHLGNGDIELGWHRAYEHVPTGTNGGIRALRHLVITTLIRNHARFTLTCIHQHLRDAPTTTSQEHRQRIAKHISKSGLAQRTINSAHLLAQWDRVAGGYLDTLLAHHIPQELA